MDSELVPVMETRHVLETLLFVTTLDITESMFHSELEGKPFDTVRTSICTYLQFYVSELTSRKHQSCVACQVSRPLYRVELSDNY